MGFEEPECVTVSVSIAVSVHASVSASVSVSVLVSVYCYFRHPGALPPPSPQMLQLPCSSITKGTGSLSNPLSPKAETCYPEGAAQTSIALVVLPLACVEVGFCRIRSHPCEGHRLRSTVVCVPPHSMGSGAFSDTQQILQLLEVALRMRQKMSFPTLLLLAYGPCEVK